MKLRAALPSLVISIPALFASAVALAADPPKPYDIAKRANDENVGYGAQTFDMIMVLFDASGSKTNEYQIKQFTLEAAPANENTTMSLIRFMGPPDSKGTALLTYEKKNGDEQRWLYLPETRQVKQIAGANKSGSFKGSEFSYEDLAVDTLDKYDYKAAGEGKSQGRECWKLERIPKIPDSGYSKSIACFDKENGYLLEADFYDKAGQLLKQSRVLKYEKVNGKWRPLLAEMTNVQTKKKTASKSGNYKLGVSVSPQMFTVSQLQKQ